VVKTRQLYVPTACNRATSAFTLHCSGRGRHTCPHVIFSDDSLYWCLLAPLATDEMWQKPLHLVLELTYLKLEQEYAIAIHDVLTGFRMRACALWVDPII
jgi:hypothetical protein